ncbi:MAG: hypothetical protein CMH83_09140 [Nocardioides sp.]|nr:hypothetical protein [Nocardioides sp.]
MPDPIDEHFSGLDADLTDMSMTPPSPAAIRRRGDRRRRRATGLTVAAAVAAIALVATPLALVAGDDGDAIAPAETPTVTDPEPAPSETATPDEAQVLTEIPADFPLDQGLPDPTELGGRQVSQVAGLVPCAERTWDLTSPAPTDLAGFAWDTGPDLDGGDGRRTLLLYGSAREAQRAFLAVSGDLAACPVEETGDQFGTRYTVESADPTYSGDAAAYGRVVSDDSGVGQSQQVETAILVVRRGNALLVETEDVDYAATSPSDGVTDIVGRGADVVTAMNVFLADDVAPAAGGDSADGEQAAPIPDDFPLAAGWPTDPEPTADGLVGPSRDLERFVYAPCEDYQSTLVDQAGDDGADRLRAQWSDVEDFRTRELVSLGSVEAAEQLVADLRAEAEGCVGDVDSSDGSGLPVNRAVTDVSAGDTAYLSSRLQGAIYLDTALVVQVGPYVVLDTGGSEGGSDLDAAADGQVAALDTVLGAMEDLAANGGSSGGQATPALSRDDLLATSDLPSGDDTDGPWVEATDDALTWACRPEGFAGLGADGSLAARFRSSTTAPGAEGLVLRRVRTAVLQLDGADLASQAFGLARGWLDSCTDEPGTSAGPGSAGRGLEVDAPGGGSTYYRAVTYAAPEVCTDCDGAWFDYQGVTLLGDRLLLTSYAEVGGPLPPEGQAEAWAPLLDRAVGLVTS